MSEIVEIDNKDIPDPDGDEEDEDEESTTVEEDTNGYARSIHVATLNTQVVIESNDPKDSLKDLKIMAESLIDKYKCLGLERVD
jgi:hypothetical protein